MKLLQVTRLYKFWDHLRSSYWFVPSMLVGLSVLLAAFLISMDHQVQFDPDFDSSWLFLGKSEAARLILSTIATAMITIVSLTFSMTIVVLTLASSQFGPRLLYNFMRDRSNQVALGLFLACFVFCLVILRTVEAESPTAFVPHLGTTGAMVFAGICIAMLIYFIHHIADSIQATTVIANVRVELETIVTRMIPDAPESNPEEETEWQRLTQLVDSDSLPMTATDRGILQAIDHDALIDWAKTNDLLIRLKHRPGEFVIRGDALCMVFPAESVSSEQLMLLQDWFRFGSHRTLMQDIEFAFQQLEEIAVRALSSGINDPFTAMSCIEELGSGLALMAQRGAQPRILKDSEDKPRLLVKAVDFEGVADVAFNQIRQNGASHPAVMIRMLEVIHIVASSLTSPSQRAALLRHATAIHAEARECAQDAGDRAAIDARFDVAAKRLAGTEGCRQIDLD